MKKRIKNFFNFENPGFTLGLRYLILLGLMFSLSLIYRIFTPLTAYPSRFILDLFFSSVSLSNAVINSISSPVLIINLKTFVQLIPACIAGSAYLLLLILNLTVPMNIKKRVYSIGFSVLLLLILNILRIVIFSSLYYNSTISFNIMHKFVWYFLSTIFVVVIWILTARIFKIKQIPVYSDIKLLLRK
jgi:exosortase/archaeosortase family protein